MNLSDVNTPADLQKLNNGPDIAQLVDTVLRLNPKQNFLLMQQLVELHMNYHHNMCEQLHQDGDHEVAAVWERDAAFMEVAHNVLKQVTL
jgi:hypothetical protein